MKTHLISGVIPGSIAEELDISQGDRLVSIDGSPVFDCFDYLDYNARESLELVILKANGEEEVYEIEKYEDESLGILFEDGLMDKQRGCANRCMFCFIDQLPKGMRDTLYYKDDDWRLSVLSGNYVTLTNCSDEEVERIIRLKVSPLYISVHTTDPALRERMTGNRNAGKLYARLQAFARAGISFHTQIVTVPGINDGEQLVRSVRDLAALYPYCRSVAVVPVGLTCHREGLAEIVPFTKEGAGKTIDEMGALQAEFEAERQQPFVYCADELYVIAGRDVPDYAHYGAFEQIENGVGMLRLFESQFAEALPDMPVKLEKKCIFCTGTAAYGFIRSLADRMMAHTQGLEIEVIPVENQFFGPSVTVAGLLTGSDLLRVLGDRELQGEVFISSTMLKENEDIFLDDMTLDELAERLHCPVIPAGRTGYALLDAVYSPRGGET